MMLEQDLVIILETVRIIAIALFPVTPSLSWRIYAQLGYSRDQFDAATWVCPLSHTHICSHTHKFLHIHDLHIILNYSVLLRVLFKLFYIVERHRVGWA